MHKFPPISPVCRNAISDLPALRGLGEEGFPNEVKPIFPGVI